MIKRGFITLMATLVAFQVFSQDGSGQFTKDLIPPSPEAYAFQKFGDYPVSHYTGLPNISIPIYEIKLRDISVPIQLSYHASGIKTDQVASWVGLGWSLIAGGTISRNIKGNMDEGAGGIINNGYEYPSSFEDINSIDDFSQGQNSEHEFIQDVKEGSKDSEHDIFSLNALGMNTKFIIKPDLTVHCMPLSNLKIERISTGWRVTDTQGIKYYFESYELSHNYPRGQASGSPGSEGGLITAWYINKIETPSGEEVNFHYQFNGSSYALLINESAFHLRQGYTSPHLPDGNPTFNTYSETDIHYQVPVLDKITFPTGEVKFVLGDVREDLVNSSKRLKDINIYNSNNQLYKGFHFSYDYFDSGNTFGGTAPDDLRKRLRLLSVNEVSSDGQSLPPYSFTYYTSINQPILTSPGKDHWGYYNGHNGNEYNQFKLIPNSTFMDQFISDLEFNYTGANREPSFPEMQAWILTDIQYPTGGTTHFDFEAHEYYDVNNNATKMAGGLRVKKITSTAGSDITFKKYIYKDTTNKSSGVFAHEFMYAAKFTSTVHPACYPPPGQTWSNCNLNNWFNSSGSGQAHPIITPSEVYWSNSMNGLGLTKGSSVGYKRVEEIEGYMVNTQEVMNNGKTVYTYTPPTSSSYIQKGLLHGFFGDLNGSYPRSKALALMEPVNFFPYTLPVAKDWYEGLLESKIVYAEDNTERYKFTNVYQYNVNAQVIGKSLKVSSSPGYFYEIASADPSTGERIVELMDNQIYEKYTIHSDVVLLQKTIENSMFPGEATVSKTTNYTYDNNNQLLISETTTASDGKTISKQYYYPDDYTETGNNIPMLINNHMISKPIDTRVYNGAQLVSGSQIEYNTIGQAVKTYVAEVSEGEGINFNSADPYTFTHRATLGYNSGSNTLKEVSPVDHAPSVYLWGYNSANVVAKIENATYSQVEAALGTTNINLLKGNTLTDQQVRDKIAILRNHSSMTNAMVTGYTYDPLIGMTSQTDPNGITTYYEYDDFGRLKHIKDSEGDIVKNYAYNYIPEPSLSLSTHAISSSSSSGSTNITITSNTNWSVSDNAGWITVSPASGSNNGTVSISYSENTSSSRTGTVTVSGTGVSDQTITINQSDLLSLSEYTKNILAGQSFFINVSSNTAWEMYEKPSWLEVSGGPSSGGSGSHTITFSSANGSSTQTGDVKFRTTGYGTTVIKVLEVTRTGFSSN